MFFTALTALAFTCFTNQHELGPSHAFRGPWWFWLAATGLCLGATLSVKWVGLFTVAWVGSLTILQLWVVLGDTNNVTPVCGSCFPTIQYFLLTDYLAPLVQTFLCPGVLLDCDSLGILLRYVRNPFPMLGKSRRG